MASLHISMDSGSCAPLCGQHCASNKVVQALSKHLDTLQEEHIILSHEIHKINRKGKRQSRVFVLTSVAIYNIKPRNYSVQRRIALREIQSVTVSAVSAEFTLNVPSQYDCRFDAGKRAVSEEIQQAMFQQMTQLGHSIIVNTIHQETTADWTVTKKVLDHVTKCQDKTVGLVNAIDHLTALGFKSNVARCALNKNGGNLQQTIQCLMAEHIDSKRRSQTPTEFVRQRTPFRFGADRPSIYQLTPRSPSPSLSPSSTIEIGASSDDEQESVFAWCEQ